jgi:protein ImuB
LRRYRPPLPARLEFTDGRPTFLWTERMRGEILACSNEWPSDGEWWQAGREWARSEWDITLGEGGVYRLLLSGNSYFLDGEYD